MITLVTGASGFIGSALCRRLHEDGFCVRAAVRALKMDVNLPVEVAKDFFLESDFTSILKGVHQVVHLAARVHVMDEKNHDPLSEFRRVNVVGTVNLARQAALSGVNRFIYMSSAKVNGEFTRAEKSFAADDVPEPKDPYAVSKYEAELLLRQIAAETGMEVVIIRSPLVYGPGVKGNFQSMMKYLVCGIPLPLGAIINNRRSLIGLDNLVDFIVTCLNHPAAANQVFLVSDGEDLSTVELLKLIGRALGRPVKLFYLPAVLLKLIAFLVGKMSIYQRLCESLVVNTIKTRKLLNWTPPLSVEEGLRRAAQRFVDETRI